MAARLRAKAMDAQATAAAGMDECRATAANMPTSTHIARDAQRARVAYWRADAATSAAATADRGVRMPGFTVDYADCARQVTKSATLYRGD